MNKMRGSRRTSVPAGALISLGSKAKRFTPSSSTLSGGLAKKARGDYLEVEAGELVSRTEDALSAGNLTLADSLVLGALHQLRTHSCTAAASGALSVGFRAASSSSASSSRLLAGFSVGLLVLAQGHPTLFARIVVMDQLTALLSMSPRELGISLPPAAVATIAARAKGLHVLVANLIYLALESHPKWPSHLVKIYLEDSLTDRVWVDQDECRLFVLNLETAFPKVYGDPRGLFAALTSTTTSSSSAAGIVGSSTAMLHSVLGLSSTGAAAAVNKPESQTTKNASSDEIADAVSAVHRTQPNSVAKIVHGSSNLSSSVTPRFESCRPAVEVIIVNTLRDALGRRGANPVSGVPGTSSVPSVSGPGIMGGVGGGGGAGISGSGALLGATGASALSAASLSTGTSGSMEVSQLRSLIRTVAMAVGVAEVRGLVTARLEPLLTNPKMQLFSVGLLALLATNCRSGGTSPYDLDLMVSMIFRIRYKLLKPNIQMAFFECLVHLVKASPSNLYVMVNLCAASELRPPLSPDAIESKTPSAPHVGQALLRISEAVRTNMDTMATSDGTAGSTTSSSHTLNTATMAAVAAGASAAAARATGSVYCILPFLCQRFSAQWVRLLGNVLHERLVLASTSFPRPRDPSPIVEEQLLDQVNRGISPIYQFLRDLSRNWRNFEAMGNPIGGAGGTGPTSTNAAAYTVQSYLPCADLAAAILQDRSHRGASITAATAAGSIVANLQTGTDGGTTSVTHIGVFQFYLTGLVSLVGALQMLSASRPFLSLPPNARRSSNHSEAMKAHQLTLRQIRLAFIRWTKTMLHTLFNAALQCFTTDPQSGLGTANPAVDSALLTCFAALKPSALMHRALMLDSLTPLHRPQSVSYELSNCYPVRMIWNGEQDKSPLARLVTDAYLPEKLAHQILLLGLEPSWHLLSPLDAVGLVCELIWRAATFARDSGHEALNIAKADQLIDMMFACCTYVPEQQVPPEMTELAHASAYWKVSISAVVLSANCLQTCGMHLWSNYPTIRRLMEMVITGDFTCPVIHNVAGRDAGVTESERLNAEMELQLVLRLETLLLNGSSQSPTSTTPVVQVQPETSKLLGRLVRNNPRVPCRLPPTEQLEALRFITETLQLGRKLWSSREPDFLLELIRSQSTHTTVQPWLVRLVESSGSEFELLPVQCLCEYLLCDTIARLQTVWKDALPSLNNWATLETMRPIEVHVDGPELVKDQRNWQRIHRLREDIRTFSNSSTSDALVHSFFSRLSDPREVVRRAVRQCLHTLASSDSIFATPLDESVVGWLQVLQRLRQILSLRPLSSGTQDQPIDALQQLLSAILTSLVVEDNVDILTAHIIFLRQLTIAPNFVAWRPVAMGLTNMILSRPRITACLLHRQQSTLILEDGEKVDLSMASLEALSDTFVRYIGYICTAVEAIPVDDNKSIFVEWSDGHKCPLELDCIQAQLLILVHTHSALPEERQSIGLSRLLQCDDTEDVDSQPDEQQTPMFWTRLRDIWCLSDTSSIPHGYNLPHMSPLVFPLPACDATTVRHVTFIKPSGDSLPKPCLSTELRSQMIQTNQPPIVATALWSITNSELLNAIERIPIFALSASTASLLHDRLSDMKGEVERTDLVEKLCLRLNKLTNRSANRSAEPMDVCESNETSPTRMKPQPSSSEPTTADLDSKIPTNGSLWPQILSTLKQLSENEQVVLVCHVIQRLALDGVLSSQWLDQLNQELEHLESGSDRVRGPCKARSGSSSTRKSPSRSSIRSRSTKTVFALLSNESRLIRLVQALVSACLFAEPEPKPIGTQFTDRLNSLISQQKSHLSADVKQAFSCLLPKHLDSDSRISSPEQPKPDKEIVVVKGFSAGAQLDLVCLRGLSELVDASAAATPAPETVIESILSLVFTDKDHLADSIATTAATTAATTTGSSDEMKLAECGDYLVSELLNQADPSFLLQCLRDLLPRLGGKDGINPSRVLDFLTAVLTLPRITYPVPRSEPRDRPDSLTALAELFQPTLAESIGLIGGVLQEATQVMEDDMSGDTLPVHLLTKRIPLLDMAVTHWPRQCVTHLERLAGFPHSTLDNSPTSSCDTRRSRLAQHVLLRLYLRWPGLRGELSCPETQALINQPPSVSNKGLVIGDQLCRSMVVQPEIDRLGPLILSGLTSNDATVADTARMASQALVVHHPRACLQLLPALCTLSEGALGQNWPKFASRKSHLLYEHLLDLLELLTHGPNAEHTGKIESADVPLGSNNTGSLLFSPEAAIHADSLNRLLSNFIGMLIQYHQPGRRLSGFATKLANLLLVFDRETRSSWWKRGTLLDINVREQITILADMFDEFSPCIQQLAGSSDQQTTSSSSIPLTLGFSTSKTAKRNRLTMVLPFVLELKMCQTIRGLTQLLEDLDETSIRRLDMLGHFKAELERLIVHPNQTVSTLAVRLLLRLLHHQPQLAPDLVQYRLLPLWSRKLQHSGGNPTSALLTAVSDLCLLAPCAAPRLLCILAESVLLGLVDESSLDCVSNVVTAVQRLTLDGLDAAEIELAASALLSRSSLIRRS